MDLPSTFWDYMVRRWLRDAPVFPISQVFGFNQSSKGSTLSYDEFSAPVSITATTEATSNTILTSSAAGCAGTPIRLEFFAPVVDSGTPGANSIKFVLYQDGVDIGLFGQVYNTGSEALDPVTLVRRIIPTAGVHTFSVRAFVSAGTGSVSAGVGTAGNFLPGYIWVTQA